MAKKLKWWKVFDPEPPDGTLFIAMVKSFDIPQTIAAMIRNAKTGMVSVVLSRQGGKDMVKYAEQAASERRVAHPEFKRIIWWNGPTNNIGK